MPGLIYSLFYSDACQIYSSIFMTVGKLMVLDLPHSNKKKSGNILTPLNKGLRYGSHYNKFSQVFSFQPLKAKDSCFITHIPK